MAKKSDAAMAREMVNQFGLLGYQRDLLRRLAVQSELMERFVEVSNWHHCDCTELPYCKGRVCCELLHLRNEAKGVLGGE